MKIIFLDIDGVLNSTEQFNLHNENNDSKLSLEIYKYHIKQLNNLIEQTGAYVVISSSWKHYHSVVGWNDIFKLLGIKATVIGTTPQTTTFRGTQILVWLLEHKSNIERGFSDELYPYEVESFVILDDDSDMEMLLPRLVQCNAYSGLTEKEVNEAIELLNKPYKINIGVN